MGNIRLFCTQRVRFCFTFRLMIIIFILVLTEFFRLSMWLGNFSSFKGWLYSIHKTPHACFRPIKGSFLRRCYVASTVLLSLLVSQHEYTFLFWYPFTYCNPVRVRHLNRILLQGERRLFPNLCLRTEKKRRRKKELYEGDFFRFLTLLFPSRSSFQFV